MMIRNFSYNFINGLKEQEIKLINQDKSIKDKFRFLKTYLKKKTDYLPYETFRKTFQKKLH